MTRALVLLSVLTLHPAAGDIPSCPSPLPGCQAVPRGHRHTWHVEAINPRECLERVGCCVCGVHEHHHLPGCEKHGAHVPHPLPDGFAEIGWKEYGEPVITLTPNLDAYGIRPINLPHYAEDWGGRPLRFLSDGGAP